ncbi:MAG: MotE family protein [Proteobacteria bacterium]|nr:MotE family protein [Pseudomonadota bacterium]
MNAYPSKKTTSVLLVGLMLFSAVWPAFAEDGDQKTQAAQTSQDQPYGSVEERRIMERLQVGGSPLAREREELESKQNELKRLAAEVDKKIEQLDQLRVRVEKLLEQKSAEEQKRIGELAKTYEKMSADKAATVLSTVDQALAVAILGKMKTKATARILNNMDREKAAKLTTTFSLTDTR